MSRSRPPPWVRTERSARGRRDGQRCCPSRTSPTSHRITSCSCPLTFVLGSPALGHGARTASSKHSPRVPERPLLEEYTMDDEQPTSESGPLADWFEWIEPVVVPQGHERDKPATAESDPDDATAGLTPRAWPPRDEQMAELVVLAPWVNRLQKEYAAAGDWLVPCWWRHRFAINELAALRIAWMGSPTSKKASASSPGTSPPRSAGNGSVMPSVTGRGVRLPSTILTGRSHEMRAGRTRGKRYSAYCRCRRTSNDCGQHRLRDVQPGPRR